ncbi:Restriction endonuclease [Pacmanvirus A23]|uniref:HNH endonuclease n=1 Tax=Pacmanvirus A23 TaxID=1932881 RepID=UPI000A092D0A|nr:HNH endonuclease [Pacmanvirus A23]SIP86120.1 Restriction endonuclease [Pacmanvirus A23]
MECETKSRNLCDDNSCQNCFNRSFASCLKSQYWSDKNLLKPRTVFKNSAKKYLFDCDKCGHEFETGLSSIVTMNSWCPYCGNQKLCNDEDCVYCFDKSFQSCDKSQYWSIKNICSPREIFLNTKKKYLFDCDICGHEFETDIGAITKGSWCSYCANKTLCNDEDCVYCFDKSFQSCDKSQYWSIKNNKLPRQVFKSSGKKYLFDCINCRHEFMLSLIDITSDKKYWCLYCSNQKLCIDKDCVYCFDKSFQSSKRVNFWSSKNNKLPRQVFKSSGKKYWFICAANHEFESQLNSINNGNWCPYCKNKTEGKLLEILLSLGYDVCSQAKFEWCKNPDTGKYLPFDFIIDEYKIIIELDGRQHFEQVSNWEAPKIIQKRDKYKMSCANSQNYTIIRILQEDVANDRHNWIEKLENHIYTHDTPDRVYISTGNEYQCYN